jgi:hypothetical protein
MMSQYDLKLYLAAYPEQPPRTKALEQSIGIGTGFHRKWYRSQREHWLGWLIAKDCEAKAAGKAPNTVNAKERWQKLACSPAMFWIAECSQMPLSVLKAAEKAAQTAAAKRSTDGHPHGKLMRAVLSWEPVEAAILSGPPPVDHYIAQELALPCFDRLCEKRSEFRRLRQWL